MLTILPTVAGDRDKRRLRTLKMRTGAGNAEAELEGAGGRRGVGGRLSSALQHPPGRMEKPLTALS